MQLTPPGKSDGAATDLQGVVVWCRLEGLSYQAGLHFAAPPHDLMDILESAS